jgi:hypothetical protein
MQSWYNLHQFESATEHLEFIDPLPENHLYLFPVAECVEGGECSPNPLEEVSKAANKWPASTFPPGQCNRGCSIIKFYHWVNNFVSYADGFFNSMIDDKHIYIPSPLLKLTCMSLPNVLLAWENNKGVTLTTCKSLVK